MSEFNEYNSENQSYRRTTKVKKSGHPILTVLLSMAMGLAAGAGGSYYVLSHYGTSVPKRLHDSGISDKHQYDPCKPEHNFRQPDDTEAAAKAAPSTR